MNSYACLCFVRFGPFYKELGVGLLVRFHYYYGRCMDSVGRETNFKEFTSRLRIVDRGVNVSLASRNTQNLLSVLSIIYELLS